MSGMKSSNVHQCVSRPHRYLGQTVLAVNPAVHAGPGSQMRCFRFAEEVISDRERQLKLFPLPALLAKMAASAIQARGGVVRHLQRSGASPWDAVSPTYQFGFSRHVG
jgi:hypothetical protein